MRAHIMFHNSHNHEGHDAFVKIAWKIRLNDTLCCDELGLLIFLQSTLSLQKTKNNCEISRLDLCKSVRIFCLLLEISSCP